MKTSLFMYVDKLLRLKAPVLEPAHVTWLGGVAIDAMLTRVGEGKNLKDQPAKPYSPRKVYIPVTGKGRSKTSLKGRQVFTPKDLSAVRKAGQHKIVSAGNNTIPSTAQMIVAQRTRRSLLFPGGRAEYKRFMGKPGYRDLQESGRMLGSIGIVAQLPSSVRIGFTREEEHRKALGNQSIEPWFGLSPANIAAVQAALKTLLPAVTKSVAGSSAA